MSKQLFPPWYKVSIFTQCLQGLCYFSNGKQPIAFISRYPLIFMFIPFLVMECIVTVLQHTQEAAVHEQVS